MNTPKPCDTCYHLYYDCIDWEYQGNQVECKKGLAIVYQDRDEKDCPGYQHWHQKEEGNAK